MPAVTAENTITVQNLLAAFEGESNAHAKYTAFAVKADEDGLHGAASLFRAAARAEQIHAANHARVIGQLGGHAECEIHAAEVKDTLENLKTALGGEQYEVATMYPGFLEEATSHKNSLAIRTFTGALEAEKTHSRLYAEAIALLEASQWSTRTQPTPARLYGEAIDLLEAGKKDSWVGEARDFYVCPVCGYTSESEHAHVSCPVCGYSWKKFEVVR
jgi:rubrerythrin